MRVELTAVLPSVDLDQTVQERMWFQPGSSMARTLATAPGAAAARSAPRAAAALANGFDHALGPADSLESIALIDGECTRCRLFAGRVVMGGGGSGSSGVGPAVVGGEE